MIVVYSESKVVVFFCSNRQTRLQQNSRYTILGSRRIQIQVEKGQHKKRSSTLCRDRTTQQSLRKLVQLLTCQTNNTGKNKDKITGSSHLLFPNRELQQRYTASNNHHTAYKEGQWCTVRRWGRTGSHPASQVSPALYVAWCYLGNQSPASASG